MEAEQMAAIKMGESEMLEEMHEEKIGGSSESDSDFAEDETEEKERRRIMEQRL